MTGIAYYCIGVGSVYPLPINRPTSPYGNPSCMNEVNDGDY